MCWVWQEKASTVRQRVKRLKSWTPQIAVPCTDLSAPWQSARQHGSHGSSAPRRLVSYICNALSYVSKAYCIVDALDEMDDNNEAFLQKLIELVICAVTAMEEYPQTLVCGKCLFQAHDRRHLPAYKS